MALRHHRLAGHGVLDPHDEDVLIEIKRLGFQLFAELSPMP